jgi:hypothetical protein
MSATTDTAAITYAAASQVAEAVSIDELSDLLATDRNPEVFPGPRKARRLAINARLVTTHFKTGKGFVGFDYFTKNGRPSNDGVVVGYVSDFPIFRFEDTGSGSRTVKVEVPAV